MRTSMCVQAETADGFSDFCPFPADAKTEDRDVPQVVA